tara:strand:- start:465 stop:1400 length:936 start_codon:yes stop_codon:yes gene_type:complete
MNHYSYTGLGLPPGEQNTTVYTLPQPLFTPARQAAQLVAKGQSVQGFGGDESRVDLSKSTQWEAANAVSMRLPSLFLRLDTFGKLVGKERGCWRIPTKIDKGAKAKKKGCFKTEGAWCVVFYKYTCPTNATQCPTVYKTVSQSTIVKTPTPTGTYKCPGGVVQGRKAWPRDTKTYALAQQGWHTNFTSLSDDVLATFAAWMEMGDTSLGAFTQITNARQLLGKVYNLEDRFQAITAAYAKVTGSVAAKPYTKKLARVDTGRPWYDDALDRVETLAYLTLGLAAAYYLLPVVGKGAMAAVDAVEDYWEQRKK